jgi:hypothetical protein
MLRDAVRGVVEELCPGEVEYFDVLWHVHENWVKEQSTRSPSEWRFEAVERELASTLAAGGAAETMDLLSPRVLVATHAAFLDVAFKAPDASSEAVREAVERYAGVFRVPSAFHASLERIVHLLAQADLSKLGIVVPRDVTHDHLTILRWDTGELTGYRDELWDEVERTRHEQEALDVFLDDLDNVFLVGATRRSLPPLPRRLLVHLLQRVGDYWTYAALFEKLWDDETEDPNNLHQALNVLHDRTGDLLKPYLELPSGLERCYVKRGLRENVKYAAIYVTGTY